MINRPRLVRGFCMAGNMKYATIIIGGALLLTGIQIENVLACGLGAAFVAWGLMRKGVE